MHAPCHQPLLNEGRRPRGKRTVSISAPVRVSLSLLASFCFSSLGSSQGLRSSDAFDKDCDRALFFRIVAHVVTQRAATRDAVARLVGIEGGEVSGVFNLELSGVRASDWRPRHDKRYHEA